MIVTRDPTSPSAPPSPPPMAGAGTEAAAARLARLRRSEDFRAASRGVRVEGPLFALRASRRAPGAHEFGTPVPADAVRVGLTLSRKVGHAVLRNRIRRRLRAALRGPELFGSDAAPGRAALAPGLAGLDSVLVAKTALVAAPFQTIGRELRAALERVGRNAAGAGKRPRRGRKGSRPAAATFMASPSSASPSGSPAPTAAAPRDDES